MCEYSSCINTIILFDSWIDFWPWILTMQKKLLGTFVAALYIAYTWCILRSCRECLDQVAMFSWEWELKCPSIMIAGLIAHAWDFRCWAARNCTVNLVTVTREVNVMLAFIWLWVYFTSLKDSVINALSFYVSFEYLRELPVLRFIYIFLIFVNLNLELPIFVVGSNVPAGWLLVVVLELGSDESS